MLNLNRETIERANAQSHFNAGDVLAREAESVYSRGIIDMTPDDPDALNERQEAILADRCAQWKTLVEKAYNDIIARRASWVPWTVAGPSRYDCKRNNAKADAELKASREWQEKLNHFTQNTADMIRDALPLEQILAEYRSGKRRDPISGDDPDALEKLTARLEGMEERHETDKKKNAYWRKHGTMKGFPGIDDDRAARLDEEINNAPSYARAPVASFTLTNRNAEMKRIRARIETIRAQRAAGDSKRVYNGFTIEQNAAAGRINITFDEKPEKAVCDLLGKNGFHWSPRAQIWTRQLTANAERAVRLYIVPALQKLPQYSEQEPDEAAAMTPEEFTKRYC